MSSPEHARVRACAGQYHIQTTRGPKEKKHEVEKKKELSSARAAVLYFLLFSSSSPSSPPRGLPHFSPLNRSRDPGDFPNYDSRFRYGPFRIKPIGNKYILKKLKYLYIISAGILIHFSFLLQLLLICIFRKIIY